MFVVVLVTTVMKPLAPGKWEIASVATTTIPGFKSQQLAVKAAGVLNMADEGPVQRRAFALQQE